MDLHQTPAKLIFTFGMCCKQILLSKDYSPLDEYVPFEFAWHSTDNDRTTRTARRFANDECSKALEQGKREGKGTWARAGR